MPFNPSDHFSHPGFTPPHKLSKDSYAGWHEFDLQDFAKLSMNADAYDEFLEHERREESRAEAIRYSEWLMTQPPATD